MSLVIALSVSGAAVGDSAVTGSALARVNRVAVPDMVAAAIPVRPCPSARRGLRFFRSRYVHHVARRGVTVAWPPGRKPRSCADARYLAKVWASRSFAARKAAERWEYEYAWWLWLPANWRALGSCETGYGREPGNFAHDSGSHVSFAGITRVNYTLDAHRIGQLSWDETKRRLHRLPTPREQFEAAKSHLAFFGDGWTCPGP